MRSLTRRCSRASLKEAFSRNNFSSIRPLHSCITLANPHVSREWYRAIHLFWYKIEERVSIWPCAVSYACSEQLSSNSTRFIHTWCFIIPQCPMWCANLFNNPAKRLASSLADVTLLSSVRASVKAGKVVAPYPAEHGLWIWITCIWLINGRHYLATFQERRRDVCTIPYSWYHSQKWSHVQRWWFSGSSPWHVWLPLWAYEWESPEKEGQ